MFSKLFLQRCWREEGVLQNVSLKDVFFYIVDERYFNLNKLIVRKMVINLNEIGK